MWTLIFFIALAVFCASLGALLYAVFSKNKLRLLFSLLTAISYILLLFGGIKAIDDYKIRQAIREYRIEQELGQQPSIKASLGKTYRTLTVTAEPVESI
ncbi:hypothetical protein BVG16_02680 [Paenibacillus selenitireducens]|uniref:Uncharacterized protein n=1 Tax=Paenibacillus selenitireducens TaxID=1324314 RepID=A0A1T2XN70_9BACL|nr:hypothetical protein [Paenibacillus selenitireducens]OPA81245.1 hypothetical protein BVG16_02680 [Paenibacillus selenitireducens]